MAFKKGSGAPLFGKKNHLKGGKSGQAPTKPVSARPAMKGRR